MKHDKYLHIVRERMESQSVTALTDTELLMILLDVKESTASDILSRGINSIASMDVDTTCINFGVDMTTAYRLAATFELGRRAQVKAFDPNAQMKKPEDIANKYIPLMRDLPHEEFWVVHLNKALVEIRHTVISKGGMSASVVDPHEVFRLAIIDRAAAIILLHNHPSGNPEPSREDIFLTKALVDAGAVLQLPVHDHIVIAGSEFVSLKERRLM